MKRNWAVDCAVGYAVGDALESPLPMGSGVAPETFNIVDELGNKWADEIGGHFDTGEGP